MSDQDQIPSAASEGVSSQPRPNVKRHLIAAALSTIVPGAGQLFLGRTKRAILLFLALAAIAAGFWPARLPKSYPGLVFLFWMSLLLALFAIHDALLARDVLAAKMSRWWILAGILLTYLSVNLICTSLLIASGLRALQNVSTSMEPTIFVGERFIFDRFYFKHHAEQRGDIVVLRWDNALAVKRIIAIGGDTIEGKDRKIFLNGQLEEEPFVQHKYRSGANPEMDTFEPVKIPKDKFFVMGDNRDVSLDSRTSEFGLVDARNVVGKALYGYRFAGHPLSWELH